jgi:GNAT superfamily N-acetyltransferase
MDQIRIVDVIDDGTFSLVPPCADPGFDHRSCDYWEDADRGSKAARLSWFDPTARPGRGARARPRSPFGDVGPDPAVNPFATAPRGAPTSNPFLSDDAPLGANPFAQQRAPRPTVGANAPRKLALLGRGLSVFGSYAKVLLVDDRPVGYAQFGPLSAYPRALRLRELYPQLPDAPLPAVISCVATTADARGQGHATHLIRTVCDDLAGRGFAAVEAYPEAGARRNATSGATPAFWIAAGFYLAVGDERFPVLRRELE